MHKGKFFVLTDTFELIKLVLDPGTHKLSNQRIFVFADDDLEILKM